MRIHDVMELATSEPPPPRHSVDQIIEAGQRIRRRRQWARATSGALAVVAAGAAVVATASALAVRPPAGRAADAGSVPAGAATTAAPAGRAGAAAVQPPQALAAPFTFTFGGWRVGKMRVADPIDVSTAYQIASVYADDLTTNDRPADPNVPTAPKTGAGSGQGTLYAYLTVYQPGAYDPGKLRGAQQVSIAGHPGLQGAGPGPTGGLPVRTLAWQYGRNAWAVLSASSSQADNPSAEELRQLAAGLRAAGPTAAKVPFTMGYVPSGYRLDEVAMHAMAGLNGIAAAREGDYAGALFSKPALPTSGLTEPYGGIDGADPPGSFQIFVVPAGNSNQRATSGITCGHGFCNRWADGGSVNIQVASGGRLSDAEMTRILNGIALRDVHDEGTWSTVDKALP